MGRSAVTNFAALLAGGMATALATAVLVAAVYEWTGFNLFTFNLWLIVPAGAMCVGMAAASGYGLASWLLHVRPRWFWAVQMVAIAGAAQALIYYLEYRHMVLGDGRSVASLVAFSDYLDLRLMHAIYGIGRVQAKTPELGSFGYVVAGVQFLGALLGGLAVHGFLWSHEVCGGCASYLRPLTTQRKVFADQERFGRYYDGLFRLPVDGADFAEIVRTHPTSGKAAQGAVQLVSKLRRCPSCGAQSVHEEVQVMGPKEWRDVPGLKRRTNIPPGIDVSGAYLAGPRHL